MVKALTPVLSVPRQSLTLPVQQQCSICDEVLGIPREDGTIETAAILPCSHVFGNICISRWLETESANHDCPICRRKMVYSKCGHPIKPCDTFRAPRCVQEKDMPERCLVCRAGGELAKVLKLMDERRQAEERILQGLRMQALSCVGMFGGMCWSSVESIDERVELVKRRWSFAVDALCYDFEEKEGREQW